MHERRSIVSDSLTVVWLHKNFRTIAALANQQSSCQLMGYFLTQADLENDCYTFKCICLLHIA